MKLRDALVLGLLLSSCGDDTKSGGTDTNKDTDAGPDDGFVIDVPADAGACTDKLPALPPNEINYPDSYCEGDKCQEGGCDPFGRCTPVCNAWRLVGAVSFHAATLSEDRDLGFPPVPKRSDEDLCDVGVMQSAKGAEVNCCQRGDNLTAKQPLLKLTGLALSKPATFASAAVSGVNKTAIENDWYNSTIVLSSAADGDQNVTIGNVLPNKDGTFSPLVGSFSSAGKTFNADGVWDMQTDVPAKLSTTSKGRTLEVGPSAADKDLTLVMWFDQALDFARLQLHMRGIEYTLPLTNDLACAGKRGAGGFDGVGELRAFLPLDAARDSFLYVTRSEGGAPNLCTFISTATNCDKDLKKWR